MRVYKNKDFEHEALRSIDDDSESQEISSNSTIEQSNLTTVKYLELREKRAIYMLAFTALLCSLIIASTVLAIYFYHGNLVPSDANFSDDDVTTVDHSLMEQEGMCKLIVVSYYNHYICEVLQNFHICIVEIVLQTEANVLTRPVLPESGTLYENISLEFDIDGINRKYMKNMKSARDFERRFPRDDSGARKKRPYRPDWMRNPLLFTILQGKGK